MPSRIPESLRSSAIQRWLLGEKRDKIADATGLSAGAVSNTINEWKQGIGAANADELRELAVALKKVGISTVHCATGFRVAMIMNRLGIKEDNFESFMLDVFT